jgi:hypothetical protein
MREVGINLNMECSFTGRRGFAINALVPVIGDGRTRITTCVKKAGFIPAKASLRREVPSRETSRWLLDPHGSLVFPLPADKPLKSPCVNNNAGTSLFDLDCGDQK